MDALGFLTKHGRATTKTVCERAGTSIEYFSQIAYGHRRPSVDLAQELVRASEELIPDENARLDFLSLVKRERSSSVNSSAERGVL